MNTSTETVVEPSSERQQSSIVQTNSGPLKILSSIAIEKSKQVSLRGYVTSSILIFVLVLASAVNHITEAKSANDAILPFESNPEDIPLTYVTIRNLHQMFGFVSYEFVSALVGEPSFALTRLLVQLLSDGVKLVVTWNMVACSMLLIFNGVVKLVFNGLPTRESSKSRDRMINYLMFKSMFVGAVLEPVASDMAIWTLWFIMVGFLRSFTFIARERYELYDNDEPGMRKSQVKVFVLLLCESAITISCCTTLLLRFQDVGTPILMLLVFECVTVALDALQLCAKYAACLLDGVVSDDSWAPGRPMTYYLGFMIDLFSLCLTLFHYSYFWYLLGASFTFVDIVLLLNLQTVARSIHQRLKVHGAYLRVVSAKKKHIRDIGTAELQELNAHAETCAICLQEFTKKSCRLSCGHFFHSKCFEKWLESLSHSSCTCPMCRFDFSSCVESDVQHTEAQNIEPESSGTTDTDLTQNGELSLRVNHASSAVQSNPYDLLSNANHATLTMQGNSERLAKYAKNTIRRRHRPNSKTIHYSIPRELEGKGQVSVISALLGSSAVAHEMIP